MNKESQCIFGTYNVTTGESLEGYMDKGEMKYRKYPWYKRIFFRKYKEPQPKTLTEYMGTTIYRASNWIFRTHKEIEVVVYREYIEGTNKTTRIYSNVDGRTFTFNIDAYNAGHGLICNR